MVLTNIETFLRGSKLCGESRTLQVLLLSKKKIGGNHAFSKDDKASIRKTTPYIALYFKAFYKLILLVNYLRKMCGYPQFSFWISITLVLLTSAFPAY